MSENQNKRLYVVKLGGNVFEKRFYGKSLERKVRIKLTWIKYGHIQSGWTKTERKIIKANGNFQQALHVSVGGGDSGGVSAA